jgi:hypothetical protein
MTLLANWISPFFGGGVAEGVVVWSDVTVLMFWFVLMALVGSALGILHERERGRSRISEGDWTSRECETEILADRAANHAA